MFSNFFFLLEYFLLTDHAPLREWGDTKLKLYASASDSPRDRECKGNDITRGPILIIPASLISPHRMNMLLKNESHFGWHNDKRKSAKRKYRYPPTYMNIAFLNVAHLGVYFCMENHISWNHVVRGYLYIVSHKWTCRLPEYPIYVLPKMQNHLSYCSMRLAIYTFRSAILY